MIKSEPLFEIEARLTLVLRQRARQWPHLASTEEQERLVLKLLTSDTRGGQDTSQHNGRSAYREHHNAYVPMNTTLKEWSRVI